MQPYFIAPLDMGFEADKKPFLTPDNAFQELYNARSYRNRVVKKEGNKLLGQLQRVIESQSLGLTDGAGNFLTILQVQLGLEAGAQIIPGSISVTIGSPVTQTFTEVVPHNGLLLDNGVPAAAGSFINYNTTQIGLVTGDPGAPVVITFAYAPGLPVMGIFTWDIPNASNNNENTIFFDTKYAYLFVGMAFQQLASTLAVTWTGGNADFFWATNYRGITDDIQLFYATNFNNGNNVPPTYDPIYYYQSTGWVVFQPVVSNSPVVAPISFSIFQARLIIAYYGRLLLLNTWEGPTASGAALAKNFFNRCRFSQIGDPTDQTNGWRSDVFGRGGFIDAPTNETIISCEFNKNTLIVYFERSTWQLRYVGEYGVPFLWERITSDFGCESTNSPVIFDPVVFAVGDKGITQANSVAVSRIDELIPDTVFGFKNANNGVKRVCGVRDFQKELVYWCYNDSTEDPNNIFPNRVLVYNYRNAAWATYRDNVTFFGIYQSPNAITWDSLTVTWDDPVSWDDPASQSLFPIPVSGNQQGYIHYFCYIDRVMNDPQLNITAVIIPVDILTAVQLTIVNHNLEIGDIILLNGLIFQDGAGNPVVTNLNGQLFEVGLIIDVNNILIYQWNGTTYITDYVRTPTSTAIYFGLGTVALMPQLYVQTKDFNPFITEGIQFKIIYIDFLTGVPESGSSDMVAMTVQLFGNTSFSQQGNLLIGNKEVETTLPVPFLPASDIAWHRFYAGYSANFINIVMTYDDNLMNNIVTHQNTWSLNAMRIWLRKGGKNVF